MIKYLAQRLLQTNSMNNLQQLVQNLLVQLIRRIRFHLMSIWNPHISYHLTSNTQSQIVLKKLLVIWNQNPAPVTITYLGNYWKTCVLAYSQANFNLPRWYHYTKKKTNGSLGITGQYQCYLPYLKYLKSLRLNRSLSILHLIIFFLMVNMGSAKTILQN